MAKPTLVRRAIASLASLIAACAMQLWSGDLPWALLLPTLLLGGSDGAPLSAALLPLACAVGMFVAVFGLYRLKVWGLVLNLIANVVVAVLALGGALDFPEPLVALLATTAALQLLLPLPLLVGLVRGAKPSPPEVSPRRYAFASLVVAGPMSASLLSLFLAEHLPL